MNKRGIIGISGVSESRSAFIISENIKKESGKSLIIVATEPRAKRLADDLSFFTDRNIHVMPDEDQVFLRYEAKNHDLLLERLNAMKALRGQEDCIVVAPAAAAIRKTMPHRLFESGKLSITLGEEHFLVDLKETLVSLGYERMSLVEGRGEFSMRGGILDVFTPDAENPFRIEFFDTEVDSIREFDIDTQRSVRSLRSVEIGPAEQMLADKELFARASERVRRTYTAQAKRLMKRGEDSEEAVRRLEKRRDELCEYIDNRMNVQLLENYLHYFYEDPEYLWDYLDSGTIYVDDPDRIGEMLDSRTKEQKMDFQVMLERGEIVPEDMELMTGREDFQKIYRHGPVYLLSPFPKQIRGVEAYESLHSYQSAQMMNFSGHMELLESELKAYVKMGYEICITASTEERRKNLIEFCDRCGVVRQVRFLRGNLTTGFDFIDRRLCYISDNDIFGERQQSRRRRKQRSDGQKLESFTDLKAGDFVVHENHGIGKFLGIQQLDIQGEKKDYLKIKYAGNDTLYVPVEQFDIVQKYIGSDGVTPKINKLSSGEWKLTKARARAAIAEMTQELVQLYAEREMEKGYAFSPDSIWMREFEDEFPYQETEDQLRSIEEIKQDMEKPKAMDRLLCGDVGFGKTEVAARALFKCVADGKQAAVLVPTTVLANQHFYTLRDRFEHFAVRVEMLSRFRSEAQQKKILEDLSDGKIDIIIGTHRILSRDVKFRDLGLLVIDEEHRFGVRHKEAIKKLKKNVDVLTLTATPIPRTLNMSLTGIKDMSLIEEPPEDRYPVQTYVMEQDDLVIRDAVKRELDRGGQCFVIYNRVRGISQLAGRIEHLVPEARVAVGHGRMNEQALENVMLDFVNHQSDVLVATTIVESGIDVPNANTLIIMDADRYGLAQLYQLRGRVGRSNRMAYAYLMYQKDKVLTEVSEKRLRAIREFTEFGSGFKVAMRDLEIRGAGNLLGGEQSGHMMNIGYELYCKMVEDAVRQLKGGEPVSETEEDTSVELAVSAAIPDWYIENESLKLGMYKKIASVRTPEDEQEMIDELIDRFGDVPRETLNLIKISQIRGMAEELSVRRIYEQNKRIIFSFAEKNHLTPYAIFSINDAFKGRAFVHGGVEPFIRIPMIPARKLEDCLELLTIIKENKGGNENAV